MSLPRGSCLNPNLSTVKNLTRSYLFFLRRFLHQVWLPRHLPSRILRVLVKTTPTYLPSTPLSLSHTNPSPPPTIRYTDLLHPSQSSPSKKTRNVVTDLWWESRGFPKLECLLYWTNRNAKYFLWQTSLLLRHHFPVLVYVPLVYPQTTEISPFSLTSEPDPSPQPDPYPSLNSPKIPPS